MANRAYFLIMALLACGIMARAQSLDYKQVDSTSYAQYQAGQWDALVDYGKLALADKIDFPLLRLRIAYAQLSRGNYSGALEQYDEVLKHDKQNQTARYFSLLCQKYLGRNAEASYQAAFIDTTTLSTQQIKPYGALEAGLETGVKISGNSTRGTGSYTRAWLVNRLGWKLQLDQSVAYFSQSITNNTVVPGNGFPGGGNNNIFSNTYTDGQIEYYSKLTFSINKNLLLLGAYHYLNTSYGQTTYQNHIGLVGIKYSAPYFSVQADANATSIVNTNFQQYNGQLTLYPLGNLNLYTISRISAQSGGLSQTIFSQTLGFKVAKPMWLQLSGSFGRQDDYIDADALYVYNAIDVTKLKACATAFYTLGAHVVLYLNYTFEQKDDNYLNNNYNQHSITGGFTWKF
jgi:tetratricopeptide (TPR) repeat protein